MGEQEDQAAGGSTRTVAELWAFYFKHLEEKGAVMAPITTCWNNLEGHFGELKLSEFAIEDERGHDKVMQYIELRKIGKIGTSAAAPGTIRSEVGRLVACFNWCAGVGRNKQKKKARYLQPSDIPVIELPPESDPRDRWLRQDEIQKLVDAAAELRDGDRLSRTERFVWIALETAARLTAIQELTWDRVDFETNVIHYDVPGRRKTKKRRASVPISNALLPVLQRAFKERINEFVLEYQSNAMWHQIQKIAKRAGVEDVSPHVLRHTAATHMARRGVSMWKIAGVLGNSMDIVQKVYAKHSPDGLADAVENISAGTLEPAE